VATWCYASCFCKSYPPMRRSCEECTCLWREYAETTTAHVRIEGKLEIAALSYDAEAIAELTPQVEQASMDRTEARAAIRKHEAEMHPDTGAAASG
jgi:hypothetical protein